MVRIVRAVTERQIRGAKRLVEAYASSLDFDLDFQGFEAELAGFPGDYAGPRGALLVAEEGGRILGCVALRSLGGPICEMKRLFVDRGARGKGIGRLLADAIVEEARRLGYEKIRLDTVPSMHEAIGLYDSMGFRSIEPYRHNPIAGTRYMELVLRRGLPVKEEPMTEKSFLTDIKTLRERARKHIEKGAVTEGYRADRDTVIRILNEALATEIVCVLRYKRHFYMATGINAQSVAQEFLQHANEEQAHADQIAQRIVQLGGAPNFSPEGLLTRSHSEYVEGESLVAMIREDLVAERVAIDSYREMIAYLGTEDPTTRRMLENILAMEEEHADDLVTLLEELKG